MPEPIENQYFKVGYIVKEHGLDGMVVIIPEVNVPRILDPGELVWLKNENDDLIPARIEESRVQQKNDRWSFLVKFGHIADKNQAQQLRKMPVYVNREKVDHIYDDQSLNRFISFAVRDEESKESGIVEDILDNPAHPILVVRWGGKDILVPFVDEYIIELDEDNGIVYCRKLNELAEIT